MSAEVAEAPVKQGMSPAAKLMAALTVVAVLDLGGTATGVVNHQPGGNSSYAVFAEAFTLAVWLLAVGKSLLPGRPTGAGWLTMLAALGGLHAIAGSVAVNGVARDEPMATTAAIGLLIGGFAALLFLRRS